jgi:hypothetical protein
MAKRTPVVLATPGTENITWKPTAWILTRRLPWASRRLSRCRVHHLDAPDLGSMTKMRYLLSTGIPPMRVPSICPPV